MLGSLRNAMKVRDIRIKLAFTLLIILIVRIGTQIPTPGINMEYVSSWWASQTSSAFNFFTSVTGSSLSTMSIFALGITPYITSSIIMQLLSIAIPSIEEMHRDGEDGRKKINRLTRFITVALAIIQSVSLAIAYGSSYLTNFTWYNVIAVIIYMTAGSAILMWFGERITIKGVGNGISIILLVNILDRIPSDFVTLYDTFISGSSIAIGVLIAVIIAALIFLLVYFTVYLQGGERRIPVQHTKKIQGRRTFGGRSTHIPLKVNTAGVIPVIFAASIMSLPSIIASYAGIDTESPTTIPGHIIKGLTQSSWCNPQEPIYTLGLVLYVLLLIFFAYFYTSITFNPMEIADNMKKQGGFIPGIRPGKPTSDYLSAVFKHLIFIGAIGLLIIAVIPIVLTGLVGVGSSLAFMGTSLIIIVGVVIETLKQVESMVTVKYYKGFISEED